MKRMTCDQVRDQIELYAAGESVPAVAGDIERHLKRCSACRDEMDRAHQLMAQLDWHYREPAALDRLLTTLDKQQPRHRFVVQPWVRRTAALAASLFVLCLVSFFHPTSEPDTPPAVISWLEPDRADRSKPVPEFPEPLEFAHGKHVDLEMLVQRNEALTLAPVDLQLGLANREKQTLYLHPEDRRTFLRLELSGPGVRRQHPGPEGVKPSLTPRRIVLPPGATTTLHLPWLVDGTAREPRYQFCVEPGTYTLTIHYHVPVSYRPDDPGERRIFSSRPISLQVAPR